MVDKIEMSLDDIIKQTKGSRARGGGGGSGRRGRGAGSSPRRGARRVQRTSGGVMRGRNRGGIARSSLPYTRVRRCGIFGVYDFALLHFIRICVRVRTRVLFYQNRMCVLPCACVRVIRMYAHTCV